MAKKSFKKEAVQYHTPEPQTPYLRAKQEWDERIGSARVQAKNWRIMAILSMLVALILLVLLLVSLMMHKNTVFIAQVTKGGQVVNVAPLEEQYQPTQAQEEYFIANFIKKVRGLPLDPVVAKQNWLSAYNFLTERSSAEFNRYMKEANPAKLLGKQTITVKITDINPLSQNTYQVNWVETVVDTTGKQQQQKQYSGVFTVVLKQPTTQQQILENPLGIYIANFDVSTRD